MWLGRKSDSLTGIVIISLLIFLLHSCARKMPITGGPKDEDPPKLVNSTPENRTLNFKGDQITLEFDERVKIQKIKDQLIITPRINEDYEYKENKAIIELSNLELQDSTTYTFNFRESIQDLTEGNPAENLVIILSTTNYIDSLNINGRIKYALSNKPAENTLVTLYDINDTLDIFQGNPKYFTKTNEKGEYLFTNIKNGRYTIFAVQDEDKNLKLNTKKESYGFVGDTITLSESKDSLHIDLVKRDISSFKLLSARTTGKYFEVRFNKSLFKLDLSYPQTDKTVIANQVEDHKIVRFYNSFNEGDSLQLTLTAYDSVQQVIDSTLYLKFEESKRKAESFKASLTEGKISLNEMFTATLKFSKPVSSITLDSLFFQQDSIPVFQFDSTDISWNNWKDELTIKKQLNSSELKTSDSTLQTRDTQTRDPRAIPTKKPGVKLYIGPGAFVSIENDSSQVITKDYQFMQAIELGSIKGTITTEEPSFIIQLLGSDRKVLEEIVNQKQYEFKDLEPAKYLIRVLVDKNQNGKWDKGDIHKLEVPEPVIFLEGDLVIRSNWELDNQNITF
ncbi:DUF2141 domain-containing protein [Fulvivirgaceae bacterium BMA10]|uniref:DUF2141 domain-containing protein n=1 Tax=Splendidivirga corallicola TaxID=3051826 RepID=A0ABT8KPT5_9BACT|nr:DUF2141 domain-containing protein [Fulvivirgaceae bacterium BMA10]